jgi:hypothetical protein
MSHEFNCRIIQVVQISYLRDIKSDVPSREAGALSVRHSHNSSDYISDGRTDICSIRWPLEFVEDFRSLFIDSSQQSERLFREITACATPRQFRHVQTTLTNEFSIPSGQTERKHSVFQPAKCLYKPVLFLIGT